MADTRAFNVYYANRTVLPGEVPIAGDEYLVLRGGTVYRMPAAAVFAFATMAGNTDVTTINTVDVFEAIAGTLVEGDASANFSFAANQFTFNGVNQAAPSALTAKISVIKVGGGAAVSYEIGVFVNAVQIDTGMIVGVANSAVGYVQTLSTHALQTGDIIDMRIRNIDDASDCVVSYSQLVIG